MMAFARRLASLALLIAIIVPGHARAAVEIERVVSPGGIVAWLVEDRTLPVIAMRMVFRGGAALDPAGRDGLAEMVSSLLDEGAGGMDSEAFQRALEDLATSLRFDAGMDNFSGGFKTLSANRDAAFDLVRLALTAPRFDAEPVERIRNAFLARLAREAEAPDSIAGRAWWRAAFPEHPYGRRLRGEPETIAAITVADMEGFVASRLARDNLIVGVVGDIGAAELGPLLDRTFGGLRASSTPVAVPETETAATGAVIIEAREVPQSVVVFGAAGIKRDDPDYYAAYILNHILGGGSFSSRLYREVREKRGLAYGVYTYLYPLDHAALIMGGVATQNERVAETIAIIRDEWRRLAEDGATAEELAAAKSYINGSFPLRFGSTGGVAGLLTAIQIDDLGLDYLESRPELIDAVGAEDVARVARRLLDAEALAFVVVGAPVDLEPKPPLERET